MTEHQPDPGTDPAEAYATEYRRLWDATVATLTAAVQLDHPEREAHRTASRREGRPGPGSRA